MEKWKKYNGMYIDDSFAINNVNFDLNTLEVSFDSELASKTICCENVLAYKFSTENGFLERFSDVPADILQSNNIFTIEKSLYWKEYVYQVTGITDTNELSQLDEFSDIKSIIIMDKVDSIIEILTRSELKEV